MSLKTKRNILYVASIVVRILPLIILFAVKWNDWVVGSSETKEVSNFKLAFGGIMALIFIALAVIDKLPKPNGLIFPSFLFIICICLENILADLKLILGMYIVGGALSLILDQIIKEYNKQILIEDGAKANGNEVRTILTELLGK